MSTTPGNRHVHVSAPRQEGALALIVAVLLLFSSSLAVLYLNRSLIFEQRTSSNQVKSATATQMAEAGIEWATGLLNSNYDLNTSNDCSVSTTLSTQSTKSFTARYVKTQYPSSTTVVSASTTFPGCKIDGSSMSCNCPSVTAGVTTPASLGTSSLPGFTVAFSDVSDDPEAVKVTSTGCTAMSNTCYSATKSSADSAASVSVILKLRSYQRTAPASALTCGGACSLNASSKLNLYLTNTDLNTNGSLIVSVGLSSYNNATSKLTTIPGLAPDNAIIVQDTFMTVGCGTTGATLKTFYGVLPSEYAGLSQIKTISCSDAATCTSDIKTAYTQGWRSFYFPSGFLWQDNSDLGSQSDPVNLVSVGTSTFSMTSGTIYGVYYQMLGHTGSPSPAGSNVTISGALVHCSGYSLSSSMATATLTVTYNPTVLTNLRRSTGAFVRVPGSWKDF